MVQQTSSPTEGANYRRLGRRIATTTVLGILTFSTTVAAQTTEQGSGGGGGNPIVEAIQAIADPSMTSIVTVVGAGIVVTHAVSGFSDNTDRSNRAKSMRNALGGALIGAYVLAEAIPFFSGLLPNGDWFVDPFATIVIPALLLL